MLGDSEQTKHLAHHIARLFYRCLTTLLKILTKILIHNEEHSVESSYRHQKIVFGGYSLNYSLLRFCIMLTLKHIV